MAKKTIGSVVKQKDRPGEFYIKLAPGVTISVDGKAVNTQYVNMDDPATLPDKLLSLGKISEDIAQSMRERAAKTPFVRFNLSVSEK